MTAQVLNTGKPTPSSPLMAIKKIPEYKGA